MNNNSDHKLDFSEFDELSKEEWMVKATKDLREKTLSLLDWRPFQTNEKFVLEPYHSKEDLEDLGYLQGFHNSQINNRGWNSYIPIYNLSTEFNKTIGNISRTDNTGIVVKVKELDILLRNLDKASNPGLEIALTIPVGSSLPDSLFAIEPGQGFKYLIYSAKSLPLRANIWMASHACPKSICVSSDQDSIGQQLLEYLTNFNEVLQDAQNAEINFEDICDRVFIYSITGSEFFLEIAKLRALRILVKALLESYAINVKNEIDIVSTSLAFHDYDPHGGLIKSTYAAMSSIIGGCNTLIIEPHENTDLVQGTTAQIPNILKEEAHLDKVHDAGAGSYFIENLTHKLTQNTWHQFVEDQSSNQN